MRTEVLKVLNLKKFFNILQSNNEIVKYSIEKPSRILIQNIYNNWLLSILHKTQKHLPVYLNNRYNMENPEKIPFGFIDGVKLENYQKVFERNLNECAPNVKSDLKFNLIVPKQDTMQYFIQWQRYRKFWWSSITTTPSLFSIDEINHGANASNVNIVAKFPWGSETVETLVITSNDPVIQNTSHLSCALPLETALLIILLDGLNNRTKTGYLRLHRTMTPYKMSFALDKAATAVDTLKDLANLLHYRLARNKISTLLPDFSLSLESQLQENLQMGVAYTIVLSDKTLSDGIFHLLNSSTMLKEQVHVADFDSYAGSLFAN